MSPSRATPAPTSVIVLSPGPEPVNARELDEAVTTRAAVEGDEEPTLVATAVEGVECGDEEVVFGAVMVVAVVAAVVVVVVDVPGVTVQQGALSGEVASRTV